MLIRKVFVMLALCLTCSSVMAEWTKVTSSDSGGIDVYVDLSTISIKTNTTKMWALYDYYTSQSSDNQSYLSSKFQGEYDCKNEKLRTIYSSAHGLNMGEGEIIFMDNNPDEWIPPAPDSVNKYLWKIACKKHKVH